MKSKNDYRTFFARCKLFIKMNYICKLANVSPVNFSRFMKSSDFNYCLSISALDRLYAALIDEIEKIA